MPSEVAVIVVVPVALAVAKPVLSIDAVAVLLEVQAATSVILTEPLHVVAVAANGIEVPAAIEPGFVGVTAID
jgi:hypothetical protein